MSFPNILFGPDQEIYSTYTTDAAGNRRWPLGTKLFTNDGRVFRFSQQGAVASVPGKVYQARVPITNHILQTPAVAGAIGDKFLSVTLGNTLSSIDEYRDGHLSVELGTGFGYTYVLDAHAGVAASAATGSTIAFRPGVTLQAAVPTTANSVSFLSNPWFKILLAPTTTRTMPVVGVAVVVVAASGSNSATPKYSWVQTHGPAAVLGSGTLIVGDPVVSPAGAAGAVGPQNSTLAVKETIVGYVMDVATTTNYSCIYLNID